jgi:hypothetical protein
VGALVVEFLGVRNQPACIYGGEFIASDPPSAHFLLPGGVFWGVFAAVLPGFFEQPRMKTTAIVTRTATRCICCLVKLFNCKFTFLPFFLSFN